MFLKLWGGRRSLDQILSEFYSLKRHDSEAISSFNKRFARFYYNMPKDFQPLENAAKIYYAAAFPPDLSLLLLERKSTTLQHMFADCLEVEENLNMSKKLSDQDSGGEIKDTYKLVGLYKLNEEVSGKSNLSLSMQKDDWPEARTGNPTGLFSEEGDLPCPWSNRDNFKKEFGMPMYDEYEEEYLQNILDKPAIEMMPSDKRNQSAIQN